MSYDDFEKWVLEDIKRKEGRGEIVWSLGLPPNATEGDRIKYSICREFVKYKVETDVSHAEIGKIIGVNKSRVSEILHYYIHLYSVDSLLQYLLAMRGQSTSIDKKLEEISKAFWAA